LIQLIDIISTSYLYKKVLHVAKRKDVRVVR